MAKPQQILIAGIGNIFKGDDAFGSEVARKLLGSSWPEGVRVVDFGIRSLDLTYALLDGPDVAILIDAAPRGGEPGDLYLIEPDLNDLGEAAASDNLVDAHTMDPVKVLRLAKSMGAQPGRILLVGCEPGELGDDDGRMGISQPVEIAVLQACKTVRSLVDQLREDDGAPLSPSISPAAPSHVGQKE